MYFLSVHSANAEAHFADMQIKNSFFFSIFLRTQRVISFAELGQQHLQKAYHCIAVSLWHSPQCRGDARIRQHLQIHPSLYFTILETGLCKKQCL